MYYPIMGKPVYSGSIMFTLYSSNLLRFENTYMHRAAIKISISEMNN